MSKKFFSSAVALASLLIFVGIGLVQADVKNKIIWQQSDDLQMSGSEGPIYDLFEMNPNGSPPLTNKTNTPNTNEIEPSASYDGEYVVYAKRNALPATTFSNGYDIWIRQNTTGDTIAIPNGRQPAIGPCNNKIAFVRRGNTNNIVFVASITMDAAGNVTMNDMQAITPVDSDAQWPHISPCGNHVVFASYRDGDWEIYEQQIDIVTNYPIPDVSSPTQLTNNTGDTCAHNDDIDPVYSPDGTRIAFTSDRACNEDIWIMDSNGSNPTAVTTNLAFDNQPYFSPAGTEIVFTSYRDSVNYGDIYKIMFADGDSTGVIQLTNNGIFDGYPTWGGTEKLFCATCDTPVAPCRLSAECHDTDSVILKWSDNSNGQNRAEDGFRIYYWTDNNDTISDTVPAQTGTGMYETTFAGLEQDTCYYFRVSAYNQLGEDTCPVVTACVWTCDTAPNAPSNLRERLCTSAVGVLLEWTGNDDNADSFEIQRRPWTGNNWGPWTDLATVANANPDTYNDCCSFDSCDTYQYRVRAIIAPNDPTCCMDNASTWSNTLSVRLGDTPTLWVQGPNQNGPSQCCGGVDAIYTNNSFNVRVMASCVTDLHSVMFDITFDTSVLNTQPALTLGAQFAGAIMTSNEVDSGSGRAVRVAITLPNLNDLDLGPCMNGGEVLRATFTTVDSLEADSDTLIGLAGARYTKILPSGVCGDTPTLMKTCGDTMDANPGLSPVECCNNMACDADCDGDTDLSDVTKMRRILAGADMSNCLDNMDCNRDGDRNGEDIICLMRRLIGLPCPPPYAPTRFMEPVAGTGREVAFMVNNVADLDAALLDLRFSDGIQIIGVTAGDLTEGAVLFSNIEEGRVRMVLNIPDLRGASGSGSIFKINFVGVGEFSINEIVLTNTNADFILADVSQIIGGEVVKFTPARTKLYQNFPNPLNPETLIPFDLAADAHVAINIYSLSGQLIRTLDMGKLNAGVYVKQGEAAFWDGKNSAGVEVSSGIYLYQLTAGDFTSTRKLIVLK